MNLVIFLFPNFYLEWLSWTSKVNNKKRKTYMRITLVKSKIKICQTYSAWGKRCTTWNCRNKKNKKSVIKDKEPAWSVGRLIWLMGMREISLQLMGLLLVRFSKSFTCPIAEQRIQLFSRQSILKKDIFTKMGKGLNVKEFIISTQVICFKEAMINTFEKL